MNDALNVKDLAISTIGATQLPGSARVFARVASADPNTHLRQSSHIGSLSPTTVRIAHQPRTAKSGVQRSLLSVDQVLTRLDSSSQPTGIKSKFNIGIQTNISDDVSLEEWRAGLATLLGLVLADDGAIATEIYEGKF